MFNNKNKKMKNEFYALVTLELSDKDENKRHDFNTFLKKNYWEKAEKISTTWHIKFEEKEFQDADESLNNIMLKAKKKLGLSKLDYTYQISKNIFRIKDI